MFSHFFSFFPSNLRKHQSSIYWDRASMYQNWSSLLPVWAMSPIWYFFFFINNFTICPLPIYFSQWNWKYILRSFVVFYPSLSLNFYYSEIILHGSQTMEIIFQCIFQNVSKHLKIFSFLKHIISRQTQLQPNNIFNPIN